MTIQTSSFPSTKPTLTLDFAKSRRLDPRIIFSRSSSGSYIDREGVMQYAGNDIARFDHNPSTGESLGLLVEEARTNLVAYSEYLNDSSWSAGGVSATPNSATFIDGKSTAATLAVTSTTAAVISKGLSFGTVNVARAFSVYVKKGTADFAYLSVLGHPYAFYVAVFDLTTGICTQQGTYNSNYFPLSGNYAINGVNCGNGWFRLTIITSSTIYSDLAFGVGFAPQGTGNTLVPSNYIEGNAIGKTMFVTGAQVETGSFPTSYIPTPATFTSRASSATYYDANGVIQTASTNVARSAAYFPDSNGVMRPARLLLEAAGTNLVTQSQTFSGWTHPTGGGFTLTTNSGTAPDGTNTATKLVETATTGVHRVSITLNNFGVGTISVFAKAAERSILTIGTLDLGPRYFDLASGTTPSANCKIEKLANGWYRCSAVLYGGPFSTAMVGVSTSTSSDSYAGNASSGILIWGAQAEQALYPTSYIATTTATVTRAADTSTSATVTRSADVAQIGPGTNFSSWYNQSEGTFCANLGNGKKSGRILEANDNTDNNRHGLVWTATNSQFFATTAGSTFFNSSVTTSTDPRKSAYAYKSGSYAGTSAGLAPATNSGTSIPAITQIWIGGPIGNGSALNNYPNGTISRLTYWPVRLSDSTLAAITR